MKSMLKKAVLAAAFALPLSGNAFAHDCPIKEGVEGPPSCDVPHELPEPSSPLLFLAAAGVAGIVLKIRKKK